MRQEEKKKKELEEKISQLQKREEYLCKKVAEAQAENDRLRQKIEDLNERVDVALEVNASLREELRQARNSEDRHERSQAIADEHIDILATLLSLYPYTPDKQLVFEFGLPQYRIHDIAVTLGLMKSKEARQEAVEYLRRQDRQIVERRGGEKGNHVNTKPILMTSRNGRLRKTFQSLRECHDETGYCIKTIRQICNSKRKKYTSDGYTFRFINANNKTDEKTETNHH